MHLWEKTIWNFWASNLYFMFVPYKFIFISSLNDAIDLIPKWQRSMPMISTWQQYFDHPNKSKLKVSPRTKNQQNQCNRYKVDSIFLFGSTWIFCLCLKSDENRVLKRAWCVCTYISDSALNSCKLRQKLNLKFQKLIKNSLVNNCDLKLRLWRGFEVI